MKLTWTRITVHTRNPWRIARPGSSASDFDVHRTIVSIEHDGVVGYGESAPSLYYRQTPDTVEATLAKLAPALGDDPFALGPIVERLTHAFADQLASVAAVDEALHDWVGRKLSVPVWRLLGLDRRATPVTSMTIGLPPDALESPAQYLRERVAEAHDFDILKIKVGTPNDAANLETIRAAAPDAKLRLDANCGWSAESAPRRIRELAFFGIELIEQPIPAGQIETLRSLREESPVPIFVDEDSLRPADVMKLAGIVDGINVKLSKCGGIREAVRMIQIARSAGLAIMLGCMVETSLGISAAAQIASLVDYVDLDGHLLLADDPFTGLDVMAGRVLPPDRPGLGIDAGVVF